MHMNIVMTHIVRRILISLAIAAVAGFVFRAFIVIRPIGVEVATRQHDVPVQVFGLGTVEARLLSRVGFEVSGTLLALNADHGERVAQGAVLARLDPIEQQARVAKAEASLAVARVQVQRARAILAQRQATHRRQQSLLKQGSISKEVANEGKTNAAIAEAEVTVAEVAVHQAQAQLQLEQALLQQHSLVAPYDAIVAKRHKEAGTVLNPGEPLFTLVAPDSIWALAYVDESLAGGIQVGQAAEVRLRSLPRKPVPARVERIDIESDRVSEERRVYVKCNPCPREFYLGEQVEVLITVANLESALLVPQTAVERYDGVKGFAWLVEAGKLRRRQLEFGYRTLDGRLQITTPLPKETRVVIKRHPGLREGRRARPVESAPS